MSFNFDDFADIEIDLEPGIVMRKNVELAAEKRKENERKERYDYFDVRHNIIRHKFPPF